jgi:uncharacterized protein YwbE
MAWQFSFGKQPRFSGRENTSSGKPQEPMKLESGTKTVAKALGAGEPGRAQGFRPGGHGPGYDRVGMSQGMQVKIPDIRDQSNVKKTRGVNPEDVTQSDREVNPHKDSP